MRQTFEANKDEIAGVILEPVVGNSGFIPPTQEFLEVHSRFPFSQLTWRQLMPCPYTLMPHSELCVNVPSVAP